MNVATTGNIIDALTPAVGELVEAIAAAQSELEQPKKTRTVTVATSSGGTYSYSYAELDAVIAAAIPILAKHGVAVLGDCRSNLDAATASVTTELRKGEQVLRFGPLELPIGRRDIQGIAAAVTYARRYHLSTVLGIAAENDDDGAAALPQAEPRREAVPGAQSVPKPSKPTRRVSARRLESILELAARKAVTRQELTDWAGRHGFETLDELDTAGSNELLRMLNDLPDTDDASSTIGAGGTTAAAPSESTGSGAEDAESVGDRSDAVDGDGEVVDAPASDGGAS